MSSAHRSRWFWVLGLVVGASQGFFSDTAGAATPKAPEGFRVRLVAAVPAVKFPSQVATAPDGSLFVAEDPMDQIGPADQPIDSILLFRPGQDEPTVFAEGLNAVFGMLWIDDSLYVMNMPNLTVLRDTDGDGKADERKELFTDLGVPAGSPNMLNDHIVSGLQLGIDGWLYVSVGDKGVPKATGPDGRTISLRGGGIVRCRPDGTRLEIYSSGTRNHLEPNLDARDNLFTYDNTDDGLGWWTRVTHHVDGGYYGYPFDYHDRTDRTLPRLAEYGGGSPCGGIVYNEDAWPEKYRGMVFWSEWGKRSVRAFRFEPEGASFRVAEAVDFLEPGDVEDFRPLDLALTDDGKTLYVADWSMGGWGNKKEKLGRIYAVTYEGSEPINPRPRGSNADSTPALIASLDHPSFNERKRAQAELTKRAAWDEATAALAAAETPAVAKRHLVWTVAAIAEANHKEPTPLLEALKDASADVRAQAARAIGLMPRRAGGVSPLSSPSSDSRRAGGVSPLSSPPSDSRRAGGVSPLSSPPTSPRTGQGADAPRSPSDSKMAAALIPLLNDPEPATRLQAIIALGRLGDPSAVAPLIPIVADPDVYLAHSARAALTRIGDWPAVAKGLDSDNAKIRAGVLLTLERVCDKEAVAALRAFAEDDARDGLERAVAIQYLASAHRQPTPWDGKWWGTQPAKGKPPAKTVDWSETPAIGEALRSLLNNPAPGVRIAAAAAVAEIGDQGAAERLRSLFRGDADADARAAFARSLGILGDREALPVLAETLHDQNAPAQTRDSALAAVQLIGGEGATAILLDVLADPKLDGERQKQVIAALGQFQAREAKSALVRSLDNPSADVRAAAVEALEKVLSATRRDKADDANAADPALLAIRGRLDDPSAAVRKRTVSALGALDDRASIPALIAATQRVETQREATIALTGMPDPAALAVYLRALGDRNPELRRRAGEAVAAIRDQVVPALNDLADRGALPADALPGLRAAFESVAPIKTWRLLGPFPIDAAPPFPVDQPIDPDATYPGADEKTASWRTFEPSDPRGAIDLGAMHSPDVDRAVFGAAEIQSNADRAATMAVGSDDTLTVWVNGEQVYDYPKNRSFSAEADRFDVRLKAGTNRVVVRCGNTGGSWMFAVAVAGPVDYAFLKAPRAEPFDPQRHRAAALKGTGDPQRGRALFADPNGLACLKCHVVGGEGAAVGPELSSVGAKYTREELIASVLFPSEKISSGYEAVALALDDGRVVSGILKNETDDAVEILDADAQTIRLNKAQIEERKPSDVSIMPAGLAEGVSAADFADLIAYLETLKDAPSK